MDRNRTVPNINNNKLPIEHTGFYPYLQKYLEAITIKNYSHTTIDKRDNVLRRFIAWCDERELNTPQDTQKTHIQRYQKTLHYCTQKNGEPLKASTQSRYISGVKHFFKWLSIENYILFNPAADVELPKDEISLPSVLSEVDIERLMQQPSLSDLKGLRDRAILEVLYSTGMRRKELCELQLDAISLSQQTVMVRKGKGKKDRLLPLGERASQWVARYLADSRMGLVRELDEQTVFLNNSGKPYRDTKLGDCVKRYLVQADIHLTGSCHLLRHAMATHMLENGADIRYLQAMLGHSNLQATEIYTHVSIRKLQAVHAATHPSEQEAEEEESEEQTN